MERVAFNKTALNNQDVLVEPGLNYLVQPATGSSGSSLASSVVSFLVSSLVSSTVMGIFNHFPN